MINPRIGQVWEIGGSIEVITGWHNMLDRIHNTFIIYRVDDAAGRLGMQIDTAKEDVLTSSENNRPNPTNWVRIT